ncbi:MAG: hypothetical protein MJ078_02105 [Clostridia bacterium]|nr:hypothetical protein [Clostridia bacterium]
MKKLTAILLLCVALLLSCGPFFTVQGKSGLPESQHYTPVLTASSSVAHGGEEVILTVSLSGMLLKRFAVGFRHDAERLVLREVTCDGDILDLKAAGTLRNKGFDTFDGAYGATVPGEGLLNAYTSAAPLFFLHFSVREDAPVGDAYVSFTGSKEAFVLRSDLEDDAFPYEDICRYRDGKITVLPEDYTVPAPGGEVPYGVTLCVGGEETVYGVAPAFGKISVPGPVLTEDSPFLGWLLDGEPVTGNEVLYVPGMRFERIGFSADVEEKGVALRLSDKASGVAFRLSASVDAENLRALKRYFETEDVEVCFFVTRKRYADRASGLTPEALRKLAVDIGKESITEESRELLPAKDGYVLTVNGERFTEAMLADDTAFVCGISLTIDGKTYDCPQTALVSVGEYYGKWMQKSETLLAEQKITADQLDYLTSMKNKTAVR